MNPDQQKIERLIMMAERLIGAIEADIAALEAGRPRDMRTIDPEIQRLSAMYGREAASLDPERAKAAPTELGNRLFTTMSKFRDTLRLHARLVTRVRNASEGIVKAVAEEVERRRAPLRTYAPATGRQRSQSGAMVYNAVV